MAQEGATTSTSGTALYYPFIHPREANDLKQSLLYWDQVRRITPKEVDIFPGQQIVDGDDNPDVIRAAEEGLLFKAPPRDYEGAAELYFLEKVDEFIADKEQYATWRIDDTPQVAGEGWHEEKRWHVEKLGGVVPELVERGLARRRDGPWIDVSDELASFYVHCLASEMSRRMKAPLFTDSLGSVSLGQSLVFDPGPSATEVSRTPQLVQLGIQLPSPDVLASVPMQEFITFHKKRGAERRRFRKAIEEILSEMSSMDDVIEAEDYMTQQRAEIEEATEDLRKTINELRVQSIYSVVKIQVPSSFAALGVGLAVNPVVGTVLGAAGIALNFVKVYAETRGKLREATKSSPYYYRLALERKVGERV
jgi:hypothetical protein